MYSLQYPEFIKERAEGLTTPSDNDCHVDDQERIPDTTPQFTMTITIDKIGIHTHTHSCQRRRHTGEYAITTIVRNARIAIYRTNNKLLAPIQSQRAQPRLSLCFKVFHILLNDQLRCRFPFIFPKCTPLNQGLRFANLPAASVNELQLLP